MRTVRPVLAGRRILLDPAFFRELLQEPLHALFGASQLRDNVGQPRAAASSRQRGEGVQAVGQL